MSETITIALNRLSIWKGNVRRTGAADGIDELAASIAAHGLLQSLVVREAKRGKYEIIAGQRRYLALKSLARNGTIDKDHPVPCIVANEAVDASELSLAENVIRAPMHPADQFEAFRTIIDTGASIADVAARFGVTEQLVAKRLKLGRLSPVILDAYRQGSIDLDNAQAFAISDDHAEQERVFNDLPEWSRNPRAIREALTEQEVPATDKRVRFVGLDAYEQAGGSVRRDLFDDNGGGYVQDAELLNSLVTARLSAEAETLRAEGWAWIETVPDLSYDALAEFSRVYPERAELSEADQSELDALTAEYDELAESNEDADQERLEAIEQRIEELRSTAETWAAESLAIAGAMVALDYQGNVRIERGLVRKDDIAKAKSATKDASGEGARPSATLSASLVTDLTAQKAAAIGAVLANQRDIALAAVVHALALGIFYPGHPGDTCLELRINEPNLRGHLANADSCKALSALAQHRERWADRLPGNPADLWAWCLDRSRDESLDLLAFMVGSNVNAVQAKTDRPDIARLAHGDALARALRLDMTAWFQPIAENYFGRIAKGLILAAIDEAKGSHAPTLDKLKKAELAARAEALLAGTGWLPAPLRITAESKTLTAEVLPEAAE